MSIRFRSHISLKVKTCNSLQFSIRIKAHKYLTESRKNGKSVKTTRKTEK